MPRAAPPNDATILLLVAALLALAGCLAVPFDVRVKGDVATIDVSTLGEYPTSVGPGSGCRKHRIRPWCGRSPQARGFPSLGPRTAGGRQPRCSHQRIPGPSLSGRSSPRQIRLRSQEKSPLPSGDLEFLGLAPVFAGVFLRGLVQWAAMETDAIVRPWILPPRGRPSD